MEVGRVEPRAHGAHAPRSVSLAMPTMRPLAALSLVLSLGAVGLVAAPSTGRATADAPGDLLVWGLDANDHRTTVWLHANGRSYEVLGRR